MRKGRHNRIRKNIGIERREILIHCHLGLGLERGKWILKEFGGGQGRSDPVGRGYGSGSLSGARASWPHQEPTREVLASICRLFHYLQREEHIFKKGNKIL